MPKRPMNNSKLDPRVVNAAVQYFENVDCTSANGPKTCFSYGKALSMRLREMKQDIHHWEALAESRQRDLNEKDQILAQQRAQIRVLGEKLNQC